MFYLIGLGLGDAKDITVKGLEAIKTSKRVYLEAYTSILTVGKEALEAYYGREVILADRDMVEKDSADTRMTSDVGNELLMGAEKEDIAFLVVGDPLGATTHTDLILRAVEKGIPYNVIHNASIMNAVGCCGLQLYNFGETVSIVFWEENWQPESFYDKILSNREKGMHTLCLLDIKMKEQTIENMMRGRPIYEPPRFLKASQASQQLLTIVERRDKSEPNTADLTADSLVVAVARVGATDQKIVTATLKEMATADVGPPLHSLVIPGHMHPLEEKMLEVFALNDHVKSLLCSNR